MIGFRSAATGAVLSLAIVAGSGAGVAAQEVDASAVLGIVEPQVTIALVAEEPASVEGVVVLRSEGDLTEVLIEIRGAAAGQELAGALLSGSCSEDGSLLAELGEIELDAEGNGHLTTDLPVPFETITANAISVELGEGANGVLACGDYEPTGAAESITEPAPTPASDADPAPAAYPEPAPAADPQL